MTEQSQQDAERARAKAWADVSNELNWYRREHSALLKKLEELEAGRAMAVRFQTITEAARDLGGHGCVTGDCPCERVSRCAEHLIEAIEELANDAKRALGERADPETARAGFKPDEQGVHTEPQIAEPKGQIRLHPVKSGAGARARIAAIGIGMEHVAELGDALNAIARLRHELLAAQDARFEAERETDEARRELSRCEVLLSQARPGMNFGVQVETDGKPNVVEVARFANLGEGRGIAVESWRVRTDIAVEFLVALELFWSTEDFANICARVKSRPLEQDAARSRALERLIAAEIGFEIRGEKAIARKLVLQ